MNILLICDTSEQGYLSRVRSCFEGHTLYIFPEKIAYLSTIVQLIGKIEKQSLTKIDAIASSSYDLLQLLVKKEFKSSLGKKKDENPIGHYMGALFFIEDTAINSDRKWPLVVLPPLKQIYSKPEGKFLIQRCARKLWDNSFPAAPKLEWELLNPDDQDRINYYVDELNSSEIISVDIETKLSEYDPKMNDVVEWNGVKTYGLGYVGPARTKTGKSKRICYLIPEITCVGYSYLYRSGDEFYSKTIVLPMNCMAAVHAMRRFNNTKPPKIMQNGRYDSMYFMRYSAPLYNWKFDTYLMMHSWYAELKRSLEFIAGLFVRNYMYWKDESGTNLYEYNAKDCHQTLFACLFMLQEWPQWAKDNYDENFKQIFPAINCGVEGWKVDPAEHKKVSAVYTDKLEKAIRRFEILTNTPGINADSHVQMKKLLRGTGFHAQSTDSKTLLKYKDSFTFWDVLATALIDVRKASKSVSTYMNIPYFCGRLMFELDPGGTDTGRYASKASSFWCGTQIQNIPEYARSMYVADDGYEIHAIDNAQSESRTTAYISQDENLIATVEDKTKDFHKTNASLFFGFPYNEITVAIRKVAKRVNHGANYNMGDQVLLETMGAKAVIEAKHLIGLPAFYSLLDTCHALLQAFDKTYPRVRKEYYEEVAEEISRTGLLTGATGWTRYCFGHPKNSKPELNSYVAHPPQSLSVKMINAAFFDAWYEYQWKRRVARFKAQVHDEIIFQTLPENSATVVKGVSELMARPVQVKGRTLIIPNDPKTGKYRWSELKD